MVACADAGPFACHESYCPSIMVECTFLSERDMCMSNASSIFPGLAELKPYTIGELCPQSCDLCDERCDQPEPPSPMVPAPSPTTQRGEIGDINNTCLAEHWTHAVRVQTDGLELTRTFLAQSLLSVLEDKRVDLASCDASRLVCKPGKPYLQSWAVAPLRDQPLQSCPVTDASLPGKDTFTIVLTAQEHAEAAMRASTVQRTRRAMQTAGLALVVRALDGGIAHDLRRELLGSARGLRHAPVIDATHREHILLDPDMEHVARALTALGVRTGGRGAKRRGVLAGVVPDGAAVTELAAIIVRAGADPQYLHSDVEPHHGNAAMHTAFIVLQDTSDDMGALQVVPGSHTMGTRESTAMASCSEARELPSLAMAAPVGSTILMDSRTFHGGGAHTRWPPHGSSGGGGGGGDGGDSGGGDERDATARVVFYFSWVDPRTTSAPFLPLGSTYALNGELWGRMTVPLSPLGLLHAPPRRSAASHGATQCAEPEAYGGADHARLFGGTAGDAWTVLDLVTARLEACIEDGREWNAHIAHTCLVRFGAATAAARFVRHRQHEFSNLGTEHRAQCMA